jgi:hypothetical protein
MNVIITERCNRRCVYCFAQWKLGSAEGAGPNSRHMSSADFEHCLDLLERAGDPILQILGGEPTLHPEFIPFVSMGLRRGFIINVFTNGLWPDDVSRFLEDHAAERVNFTINVNEPRYQSAAETELQARSMRIASRRGRCGFNIYEPDFNFLFIREYIESFSLQKKIRLGLASPIVGMENRFVANEDLSGVGRSMIAQLSELESHGIIGMLDCGFPLCMFSESDLGRLQIVSERFFSACSPVVDVGVGLEAWPCFPLSSGNFSTPLRSYANLKDVIAHFDDRLKAFRPFGSRDECFGCKFLARGQCCGGCLARGLRNWGKSDARLLEKMAPAAKPARG